MAPYRVDASARPGRKQVEKNGKEASLTKELGMEIEEVKFLLCPREGRVKPAEEVAVNHLFGEVTLVDDDGGPLSTLRFVAGDGVGEFDLEGVVKGVFHDRFVNFSACTKVDVIFAHQFVEFLLGFVAEVGAVEVGNVAHDLHGDGGEVGVVAQADFDVGEVHPVAFLVPEDALDLQGVPVGNEGGWGVFIAFEPEVIVAHNHEEVAAGDGFFAPEDAVADVPVEFVGALVRARDDDDAFGAIPSVQGVDAFFEFAAVDLHDIGKALGAEVGEAAMALHQLQAQGVGIEEDAGVEFLPNDFFELHFAEGKVVVASEVLHLEGRTVVGAYWWQLGPIADEDESAILAGKHELHQVVKEAARTGKALFTAAAVADHRCFIDNEYGVFLSVGGEAKGCFGAVVVLDVDAAVDGERGVAGEGCQHLCCPSCWCHQRHFVAEVVQYFDEGAGHGGFSGSCIPANEEGALRLLAVDELGQEAQEAILSFGWRIGELGPQSRLKFIFQFSFCAEFHLGRI